MSMSQDLFSRYGTHLKLVAVVFVGIHVPLVLAAGVWLGAGQTEPQSILLWVLLGTVAGLAICVAGIWAVLRGKPAATG